MPSSVRSGKHCCREMRKRLFSHLDKGAGQRAPENKLILYVPPFQEYGLPVNDGGESFILIKYCPWCGAKLPQSKRNKWFSKMSRLGYTSLFARDIPEAYLQEDWEKLLRN